MWVRNGKSEAAANRAGRGCDEEPGMGKTKTSRRGREKEIHGFFFAQVEVTSQTFQRAVMPESK